jgi:choline dehydrogenase-like flavoprotein
MPMNAVDGVRMNTGLAYILPALSRANLTVLGDTFVRRVILADGRATGVEVDRGGGTEVIELRPGGEVVRSAGAFKSPHLLALSGIGPRAELEAAGIAVVADLPGVGKRFSDHPDLTLSWTPTHRLDAQGQRDAFQYLLNTNSEGSKYDGDLEIIAMTRTMAAMMGMEQGSRMSTIWDTLRRPGATLKAMKGVSLKRFLGQLRHSNDMGFAIAVQQEESRGDLTTVSADPTVYPKIDYNYLSDESDRRRMREVIRKTVAILHTEAFKPIFRSLTEIDAATLADDAKLDAWAAAHLATAIHAAGTCRMGPDPADGAVVDQYGRVHGVAALRVADTSILPFAPSRGPAATTIMIGERMAALLTEGPGALAAA